MDIIPPRDEQPADVEQELRERLQHREGLAADADSGGGRLQEFGGAFETLLGLSIRDQLQVPIEVTKWHWGDPYDQEYLTVKLTGGIDPKAYDFVAFYDGVPTDPNDWVDDHYYWMEEPTARPTLVTPDSDEVTHVGYVGFSDGRFRIMGSEAIGSPKQTRNVSNDQGVATVPHPGLKPDVLDEAAANGVTPSDDATSSDVDHEVWGVCNLGLMTNTRLVWSNPTEADKWAWVGLYEGDPHEVGKDNYVTWAYVYDWFGQPRRWYDANDDFEMSKDGHWTGFVDGDGNLVSSSPPMRSRPDWMSSMREDIRDQKLRSLCIPGTHDSGTYNPVAKPAKFWIQTQDQSISQQLEDGIRFLDIRIGYYPDAEGEYGEVFWLVHADWSTWVKLEDLLDAVGSFLHDHDEILLLNFHRFNRFDAGEKKPKAVHEKLVDRIKHADLPGGGTMSDVLAPDFYGDDVTPGKLWDDNNNVIVLYGRQNATSREITQEHQLLWEEPYDIGWPNTDTPEKMIEYCQDQIDGSHYDFWFLGSMLTATPLWGIKSLAKLGNPRLSAKLMDGWAEETNVVPVDYYRGTPHIELAVRANRR